MEIFRNKEVYHSAFWSCVLLQYKPSPGVGKLRPET